MNIVITGASKGIGRAIAEKFAAQGYSLWLCARTERDLADFADELRGVLPTTRVKTMACDVSSKEGVHEFAQWMLSQTAEVDVLVNNAGAFIQGDVHSEPDGVLETLMQTNVFSAYYLSRLLIPSMLKRKQGHIFNMCSIASLKAYPNGGSYGITKYALAGLSANLREELKEHGIKVTSVFPGAVYTASWAASGVAEERLMKASDIADLIYTTATLSPQACVEEIVVRPQLGDL